MQHYPNVVSLKRSPIDAPTTISVELTSRCNLKCGMCPLTQGTTSTSKSISFLGHAEWMQLLQGFGREVERVILTGFGEPMLHPNLVRYIADLESREIRTSLTTNGTLARPDFLEALQTFGYLDHLNVSVDSLDPQIYTRLRKGKLNKCLSTIERLVEASGPQTTLSVSAVLMRSTLSSLASAPRILADLGVRTLVLQSLFDQSPEGLDEHLIGTPNATQALGDIKREADRFGVTVHLELDERLRLEMSSPTEADQLYFGDSRNHSSGRKCGIAWDALHMDAAGQVFPCCRAAAVNEAQLGNIRDESVEDIWRGTSYQEFRESFADPLKLADVCATCSVVPVGMPLQVDYRADVLGEAEIDENGAIIVAARNTGRKTWNSGAKPSVGVSQPRDRASSYAEPTWLSPNRVCTMHEELVAAGDIAHFVIPIKLSETPGAMEHFQLVVDGVLWLPGTGFTLSCSDAEAAPFINHHWSSAQRPRKGAKSPQEH